MHRSNCDNTIVCTKINKQSVTNVKHMNTLTLLIHFWMKRFDFSPNFCHGTSKSQAPIFDTIGYPMYTHLLPQL